MTNPKFGGADVHTPRCDSCHTPIKVAFRGSKGRYCSDECYRQGEYGETPKEKTMTATSTAPATSGASKKKAAKKKAAPKKAAPKKAAPKKAAPKGNGALFREGSTKAEIFKVLSDKKPHKRDALLKIVGDKSPMLINWVLKKCKENGMTVVRDKEAKTIQVK